VDTAFTDKEWSLRFERAARDMQRARAFAYELMAQDGRADELRRSAYSTALVVSYARPFSRVESWPEIALESLPYRKTERALHARMLEDRRKLWADEADGFLPLYNADELHGLLVMIPKAESHFELSRLVHRHQMEARGETLD
jgi:hypothetical protein